jgi:hypothetical protein
MPGLGEIARSLFGVYRLARLDPGGMNDLDLSIGGFWRSFFAMVIVAPGYAVLVARKLAGFESEVVMGWAIGVEVVAYVIGWIAFPIAAIFLTRMFGLAHNYVPLIVATNWANVLQMAVFLAAMLLAAGLSTEFGGLVLLIATLAVVAYQWLVIRISLDTTGMTAFTMLAVDLVLSSFVNLFADAMSA